MVSRSTQKCETGYPFPIVSTTSPDVSVVIGWLDILSDVPGTFLSYQKESCRFLMWMQYHGLVLSGITTTHAAAYFDFLKDPQPTSVWVGPRRHKSHPDWKPFAGPLSPSSIQQSRIILNALFSYLVATEYLQGNPLSLIRKRRKSACDNIERYLDHDTWALLVESIEQLPQDGYQEVQDYERARWLIRLFYLTGARLAELTGARMSDFSRDRSQGKSAAWWLHVHGKGNKEGRIPVTDELLSALSRYREFNGLPPFPAQAETHPIIFDLNGKKAISPTGCYLAIKRIFMAAADRIDFDHPESAAILRSASPHWLRHTSATHQVDAGIDLRVVSKNLRHSRIETTMAYQHTEEDVRHTESGKLKV